MLSAYHPERCGKSDWWPGRYIGHSRCYGIEFDRKRRKGRGTDDKHDGDVNDGNDADDSEHDGGVGGSEGGGRRDIRRHRAWAEAQKPRKSSAA